MLSRCLDISSEGMAEAIANIADLLQLTVFIPHIIRKLSKKALNCGQSATPIPFSAVLNMLFDVSLRTGTMLQYVGAIYSLARSADEHTRV